MRHTRIEKHIDARISARICEGYTLESIRDYLISNIKKKREHEKFLKISKFLLLRNWNGLESGAKYTTYYAMHCSKRLEDIEWLLENRDKFPRLTNDKLFNMVLFKEKIT